MADTKKTKPAGLGHKHPQIDVELDRLHLDGENPRLPEETQGKSEAELLKVLYRDFALDELADSMAQNGYFDEEPLVAIPQRLSRALENDSVDSKDLEAFIKSKDTEFTVVEGNRRLATAKLLLNIKLQASLSIKHWPSLNPDVEEDLSLLPVIVYQKRNDVVPYLGVRHIIGIQKWDTYAKARYIAKMIDQGRSLELVIAQIGDKQGAVVKSYICYKILKQASDEFEFNSKKAKSDFSLLQLAVGQGKIKRYLGLPTKLSTVNLQEPVPQGNLEGLQNLIVWLFGSNGDKPVIGDSRDITDYLSHIVASEEAVVYLKKTRDLIGAYDRTDGEEKMLLKYLNQANTKLEVALGVAHRHKITEVITEIERCHATVKALLKTVKEPNGQHT